MPTLKRAYQKVPGQHLELEWLVLTRQDLMKLNPKESRNVGLALSAQKDFFEHGEGGIEQVIKDYVERSFLAKKNEHLGMDAKSVKRFKNEANTSIKTTVNDIFVSLFGKERAEKIIKGSSQGPAGFVGYVTGFALPIETSTICIKQPEDPVVNLDQEKDNPDSVYIEIDVDYLPISSRESGNRIIGAIPGPLKVRFNLHTKMEGLIPLPIFGKEKVGFELDQLQTTNEDIWRMFRGEMLDENEIKRKYCQPRFVYEASRSALKQTLASERVDREIKIHAERVLSESDHLYANNASREDTLKLAEILQDTNKLVELPREHNEQAFNRVLNRYKQDARTISKYSRWKILGGVMLALAGVAAIVVSGLAAAASLGVLAPVSVGGVVLGAAAVSAGVAVVSGALGVVAGVGSGLLFWKSKPPLRSAMKDFADVIEKKNSVPVLTKNR